MEKLILFLIVFGIGSLFEYLKQKREQRADGHVDKIASPRAAAETIPRTMQRPRKPRPMKSAPPLPQTAGATAGPVLRPVAVQTPAATAAETEGGSIFDLPPGEIRSEAAAFAPPEEQDRQLQRHYERWRRAVIDSEILRPKF